MTETLRPILVLIAGLALSAPLMADEPAKPAETPSAAAQAPASATASTEASDQADEIPPMHFETPDAAAMELVDAAASDEPGALRAVLGSDLDELESGDPVADAADRAWFVEKAKESASIEDQKADSAILVVGKDDWPFPIPLAKDDKGWYFDTEAGIDEIQDRRIGRNELYVIAAMRAFADAEHEYRSADPMGDGVHAYAGRILSSEGKKDGLYWPTKEGEPQSPMGPLVAEAVEQGYQVAEHRDARHPFHGYYFKVLKAQGDRAPGGAKSYVKDGRLTEGVALIAWPATYGNSGIMSFQVNQRGIVYQADLGDDTAETAESMDAFNPGKGWEPVTDD